MVIQRGQIYWCQFDPVVGHEQGTARPALVVSSDAYNNTKSPLVGVMPLTRALPKTPIHIRVPSSESGLAMDSTALTDHARFVDRTRLNGEPIGRFHPSQMAEIDRQLRRLFGI